MKRLLNLKTILALLFVTYFSASLFGVVSYDLSDFEDEGTKSNIGFVNVDGKTYLKASISPDFPVGPLQLGIDLNLYAALESGADYPSELSFISLRYVGYDYHNKAGFKWGQLTNLTMGQGLLMDNYDTAAAGSSVFNTEKAGLWGYGTVKNVKLQGLYTYGNVRGGRIEYTLPKYTLLGAPIVLGGTFVEDSDGIDETVNGVDVTRAQVQGYSGDVALPFGGEFFTTFVEYAVLKDVEADIDGSGVFVGAKGTFSFLNNLTYKAGYTVLGENFVPGYFNGTYEATSFDIATDAPDKQISGFLAGADIDLAGGYFKAGGQIEKYEDQDALVTAAFGWKRFQNTVGVINYTRPFGGEDNAIAKMSILYYTGSWMDYVAHVKRVYYTGGQFNEYWQFETRINMSKLFPNIF